MWQRIRDGIVFFGWELFWSVLALALAVSIYVLLRRRIHGASTPMRVVRGRRRLLAVGLFLAVLLIGGGVWLGRLGAMPEGEGLSILMSVLWTLAVGAFIYIAVRAVQGSMLRSEMNIEMRHKIRRATSWIGILVFVIITAIIWASRFRNIGVVLGIVGAGLALSMGETLLCIAGWMVLVVKRPFDIGDRVEIDGRVGDVIGIGVFQSSMLEVGNWVKADQSTGRMLIVPNSMVLRHAMYNYTKGFPFIWDEFSIIVTFESDWERAKDILLAQAQMEEEKIESEVRRHIELMQSRYAIRYSHYRPIVYTSIAANGVELILRYLSPVRARRATTHRISESVLRVLLAEETIDFAYPTTRIFRNIEEGKPGAGGPSKPPPEPGPRALG